MDLFFKLRKLYKCINHYFLIEIITMVIVVVGWCRDCPGSSGENSIFSSLGPIVFVIWTFTVTLIVFYLGRMEDKQLGIRIVDFMIEDLGFVRIVAKAMIFVAQLIMLLISVTCEWRYTLIHCCISQVIMMLYVFVLVCMEVSRTHIRETIKERAVAFIDKDTDGSRGIDWMLSSMIFSVNYKDKAEAGTLIDFFDGIAQIQGARKGMQSFAKDFTEHVISACKRQGMLVDCVNNMLVQVKSVYAKRGIISAVLLHPVQLPVTSVFNTAFENRRELILWAIAYSAFYSKYVNREFLALSVKKLEECLEQSADITCKEEIYNGTLEFWVELVDESMTALDRSTGRFNIEFDRLRTLI